MFAQRHIVYSESQNHSVSKNSVIYNTFHYDNDTIQYFYVSDKLTVIDFVIFQ